MKITTIVRTYNEQLNLPKFIEAYDWVDQILVSDDWSDEVNYLFDVPKKVWVSFYTGERIEREKLTRAKQDIQLNNLIRLAEHIESDWIIMDDCDSIPNEHLIEQGRQIIENCTKNFIFATRLYLYKDQGYFPKLSKGTGLWAWRAHKGFKFIDNGDGPQKFIKLNPENILELESPYTLLHSPWPTDAVIKEKRERYTQIYGDDYKTFNPLRFGGALKPLPSWIYKND